MTHRHNGSCLILYVADMLLAFARAPIHTNATLFKYFCCWARLKAALATGNGTHATLLNNNVCSHPNLRQSCQSCADAHNQWLGTIHSNQPQDVLVWGANMQQNAPSNNQHATGSLAHLDNGQRHQQCLVHDHTGSRAMHTEC